MSSLTQPITSWAEFQRLPERPENGSRYELHDGEVVVVPPPRPWHHRLQTRIMRLLQSIAGERGTVTLEWPYRPAPNLQYWVADVAYIPGREYEEIPRDDWPVYAPPLIIEVMSPSNNRTKTNRQRMIALSAGTEEFWVVDESAKTVEVSRPDGIHLYRSGDTVPIHVLNASLTVDEILA